MTMTTTIRRSFRALLCAALLPFAANVHANNMLVQNVITTGNDPVNQTIQVQFDISWDNSWRDAINWDAAWVFMKFKDSGGLWRHAQLNPGGVANGTGTANTVQVTADKVGAWIHRSGLGSGIFSATGMQLQWNYGLAGLTNVTGLEVRVFAVEMVYVPEGGFVTIARAPYLIKAPGNGYNGTSVAIINERLSPALTLNDGGNNFNVRIQGNVGLDTNNDGIIDNNNYPTGYNPFYIFKYQLSEQQYADFINTLTSNQLTNIGIAGSNIFQLNGQYFSSQPNVGCRNSNSNRVFAYADWSGLRPMSFLEFSKSAFGPFIPSFCGSFGSNYEGFSVGGACYADYWGGGLSSTRQSAEASYFGVMQMSKYCDSYSYYPCGAAGTPTGDISSPVNTAEPVIKPSWFQFDISNGDGILTANGVTNILSWQSNSIIFLEPGRDATASPGFRYVRSAE